MFIPDPLGNLGKIITKGMGKLKALSKPLREKIGSTFGKSNKPNRSGNKADFDPNKHKLNKAQLQKLNDDLADNKALKDAMDGKPELVDTWKKLDEGGVEKMGEAIGKATDKDKWIADFKKGVVRNGNKAEYVNPSGNKLSWTDQHPSSLNQSIKDAVKSGNPGKAVEGKVGDFLQKQGKDIEGFGLKIKNQTSNNVAGDIDVMTKNSIIEVKKNISSFKKGQVDKFTDNSLANFLNPQGKKAILYIDEPLSALDKASILSKIPSNVTLVNSLDELINVLD
jgi:hypothetical protein